MTAAEELQALIEPYNSTDLLKCVAGLQLVPENSMHLLRMERLATLLSNTNEDSGKPRISPGRLRHLMNDEPLASDEVKSLEDPPEQPFIEEVGYVGGGYRLIPGMISRSKTTLQIILNALPLMEVAGEANWQIVQNLRALAVGCLTISDTVAKKAGLQRHQKPLLSEQVKIPFAPHLQRLKGAVTFSERDLVELLAPECRAQLASLTLEQSGRPITFPEPAAGIYATPLLKANDEVIVTVPSALAPALWFRILSCFIENGLRDNFLAAFEVSAKATLDRYLRRFYWREIDSLGLGGKTVATEAFWSMGDNCVAHTMLTVDDLKDWSLDNAFGFIPESNNLAEHIALAAKKFREVDIAANRLLHVVVNSGVGRARGLGLKKKPENPTLILSMEDLRRISSLEQGNATALFDHALALDKVTIGPTSQPWDIFALYTKHDQSFYFSDEANPNYIQTLPGTGLDLWIETLNGRDPHYVKAWNSQGFVLVERRYHLSDIPIYTPPPLTSNRIAFLVEQAPVPIWVRPRDDSGSPLSALELCETVAYWLWQCSVEFSKANHLDWPESINFLVAASEEPAEQPVQISRQDSQLFVAFNLDLTDWQTNDNQAERLLVRELVSSVNTLLERSNKESSPLDPMKVVNRRAPLGQKKKLLVFGPKNLDLLPGKLPPARAVNLAAISRVLEGRGVAAAERADLSVGQVPNGNRPEVLNVLVASLFEEIKTKVAKLSSVGLLERLLSCNESLVRELSLTRLTLVTKRECFGIQAEQRARDQIDEFRRADLAQRLLIEYITARPPTGTTPLDLITLDELVARAWQLFLWGQFSDAIQYSLADIDLAILPTGRLGIARQGAYISGYEAFLEVAHRLEYSVAAHDFQSTWDQPSAAIADKPPILGDAFRSEFGLQVEDYNNIAFHLMMFGVQSKDEPCVLRVADFIKSLTNAGFSASSAEAFLRSFSLKPRRKFIPEKRPYEAYPWRFSRDLSYVRRPLIVRGNGEDSEVLWGVRHLHRSERRFIELIFGAQYNASSPEMRREISRHASEIAEHFNEDVASFCRTEGSSTRVVRARVDRIQESRLARDNGQPIGDIDVLVVDIDLKKLIAIETKDFAGARTPFELSNEIKKLFSESGSAVSHHLERIRWLQENIAPTVEEAGFEFSSAWKVGGLIVVSRDLLAPFVQGSPIPVVSFRRLKRDGLAATILGTS